MDEIEVIKYTMVFYALLVVVLAINTQHTTSFLLAVVNGMFIGALSVWIARGMRMIYGE